MTKRYDGAFVGVRNLNEIEDAIRIEVAVLLQPDYLSRYLNAPLLTVLTLSAFAVKLYWNIQMQSDWLYRRVTRLTDATHIMILSKGKLS
jgi:hypothetical protein